MPPLVQLLGVSVTYHGSSRPALRGVSLSLGEGELCGVIGANGAGKTTLCYTITGLVPHLLPAEVAGHISVVWQDPRTLSPSAMARQVGLVLSDPQQQLSGAKLTVAEEVAFGLENLGVPLPQMQRRVEEALEELGIGHLRNRSPYVLSYGQQQLVVLAAALAMERRVLVMDEPTSQLDASSARNLFAVLVRLRQRGMALLVVDHRLEWLAAQADRLLLLREGQPILEGEPSRVLTAPDLETSGVRPPASVRLARCLQAHHLWPADLPLPITVPETIAGLRSLGISSEGLPHRKESTTSNAPASDARHGFPLVLHEVSYTYPGGVEALRSVSLNIASGDRVALVGQNGAGKSTLARHLNGLLRSHRGHVMVGDWDTRRISTANLVRRVGYVHQNPQESLFHCTVGAEVAFGPRNLGWPPAAVARSVHRVLALLGLEACAQRHPYDLGPQERRLVGLAAVLAMDTPIVVLDEPTAGLDALGLARLDEVLSLLAEQGKTLVLISHDLDFCLRHAERVAVMAEGKVLAEGSWAHVLSHPMLLEQAHLELPPLVAIGRALGIPWPIATEEMLVSLLRQLVATQVCSSPYQGGGTALA